MQKIAQEHHNSKRNLQNNKYELCFHRNVEMTEGKRAVIPP